MAAIMPSYDLIYNIFWEQTRDRRGCYDKSSEAGEISDFSPITSVIDETFLHVMKYEKKFIITRPPLAA